MKLFIKNITLYTGFVLLTALLLQCMISLKIKGENMRGHDNLEQTANINADLVFLGSSRCWAHFDPGFFNNTFKLKSVNIGVDGHSELSMAIMRLKDYLSRNKAPRFAILNFDPFVSAGNETDNSNFVLKQDFARYAFFPAAKNRAFVHYFKFDFFEKYVPLYALFKYKLLSDCVSPVYKNNYLQYGYEVHHEQWDTISRPVTDTMKTFFFSAGQVPAIKQKLAELHLLCRNNNIKLLCIQTPVYKVIYNDSVFANSKLICNSMGIQLIDESRESIRNNIQFFYNSNHLNTLGVTQMNQHLKSDKELISFFNE